MSKYVCDRCDATFTKATDKMMHFVDAHDRGFVPRDQRTRRSTACWSCNGDIARGESKCSCGWIHPYVQVTTNNKEESK
jgi:hypothetical protein